MSDVLYLHYNKDKNSLVKAYYLALIPLLLFGFYKNGILLYQNGFISFIDMLIPIYFYFISAIVGFLVAWLNKDNKIEYILYGLVLACSVSINTNMFLYPILLFVSLFIASYLENKKEFNIFAFTRLLLILALLLNSYSYLNVAEKINAFNYNYFDMFIGYCAGGIASNSFLFVIIGFFILSFHKFYKRWIPLMGSFVFIFSLFLIFLITKNSIYLEGILNGSAYFAFVFVGADLYNTPSTKRGMILYGAMIGFLTAILSLLLPIYEVPYISILVFSFLTSWFDKMVYKKYLHS